MTALSEVAIDSDGYSVLSIIADASVWVALDHEDYLWASRWVWNFKPEQTLITDHFYAKRNTGPARTPIYLHVEIMKRASGKEPSPRRRPVVDHINGNTLDCRRQNLRWASHRLNARNTGGRSFCLPILEPDLSIPF